MIALALPALANVVGMHANRALDIGLKFTPKEYWMYARKCATIIIIVDWVVVAHLFLPRDAMMNRGNIST